MPLEALQFRAGEALPALPGHEDRGLARWTLGEPVTGFRGTPSVGRIVTLGLTGTVFSPGAAVLDLGGQVRAGLTAPLDLSGVLAERGLAPLDLSGQVRAGLAAPLALDGRVKLVGAAPLALAGEVSLAARVYLPLDLGGRVRSVRVAVLGLASGYVFGQQTRSGPLAGRVKVRTLAPLDLTGRAVIVAFLRLNGRVLAHQNRALRLTGEVLDFTLPPGAPVSAYRTRLPWTLQERLRSLT